jgi:hypothetical protein
VSTPTQELLVFAHRTNDDGSFDSIYLSCFTTVAECCTEPELQPQEQKHVCNPYAVERYRSLTDAVEAYRDGHKR